MFIIGASNNAKKLDVNDFEFNSEFPCNRFWYSEWLWRQTHDTIESHLNKYAYHYLVCIELNSVLNVNSNSVVNVDIKNLFDFDSNLRFIYVESKYFISRVCFDDWESGLIVYDNKKILGVVLLMINKFEPEIVVNDLVVVKCNIISRGLFEHSIPRKNMKFEQFNGNDTLRFGDRDILENVNKDADLSSEGVYSCKYIFHSLPPSRCGDHSEIAHETGLCDGSPRFCCYLCYFEDVYKCVSPSIENCKWQSRSVNDNYVNAGKARNFDDMNHNSGSKKKYKNSYVESQGIKNYPLIPMEPHQMVPMSLHVLLGLGGRIVNGGCIFANEYADGDVKVSMENKKQEYIEILKQQLQNNEMIKQFYDGSNGCVNEFSEDYIKDRINEIDAGNKQLNMELENIMNEFHILVNNNNKNVLVKGWYNLLRKLCINPFYCHQNSITGGSLKHLVDNREMVVEFFKEHDNYLSELLSILLLQLKMLMVIFNGKFDDKLSNHLIALMKRIVIEFNALFLLFLEYVIGLGTDNERVGIKHHTLFHLQEYLEYNGVGTGGSNESRLEHVNQTCFCWFQYYKNYKCHNKLKLLMNKCNFEGKLYPQRRFLL